MRIMYTDEELENRAICPFHPSEPCTDCCPMLADSFAEGEFSCTLSHFKRPTDNGSIFIGAKQLFMGEATA